MSLSQFRPFSTRSTAAGLSIASNTVLIILKLWAGILTGSVSVIAEAIHSGLDLIAAIIAYISVRTSGRPPDEDHPYGHGKIESISGAVEGALIFVAAGLIVNETVVKLVEGSHSVQPILGIAVMGISAVTNIIVSRHLHKMAKKYDSLALEADAEHLRTDVLTSLGVFGGLILVALFNVPILDPILALGVAGLIISAAWKITYKSFQTLIDRRLPQEEQQLIERVLTEHGGDFIGYHRLRTRKSGAMRYIALDLVFSPEAHLDEVHEVCDHIEGHIHEALRGASVIIHVEPPNTVDR